MESDYLQSSECDTDSIESIGQGLIENLSEDEICDITSDILEQIEMYMTNEIISLSSPNFYKNMIDNISESVFENWLALELCEDTDEDYSEIIELVEQQVDYYLDFSKIPKRARGYSNDLENINDFQAINKKIKHLQSIPQPAQKTKEWYDFRYGLISASNLWKVFGSEAQRNSLIVEKCQPVNTNDFTRFSVDTPMHWGNKYEPVTVMIYEHMFGTRVGEFGCIQHPKYPFIGASPDGINIDSTNQLYGRMLEIKNIVNRDITGIPKEEYWVQTQIQMEVCDLDECDFMETRFLEYSTVDAFYEDTERDYRGVILHFIERDLKVNSMPIYKYMPVDVSLDKETIDEWVKSVRDECRSENLVLFNTIFWYLQEYSCVLIQRNRFWFQSAVGKIEELWRIIEKERIEGYEHRMVKKKVSVSMSTDLSNSYVINNMPLQNSICLVKLE
jgi:putative phage-type endonuclease